MGRAQGAEPAGLVFVGGVGLKAFQHDDIGHVAVGLQLDKMPFRPACIALAPVANTGEYPVVVVIAAQEYPGVIRCRVADNGANGRFEHIRIHSKFQ
ncbi:hypothetical protein D3C76_1396690 [compost metagenome]